MGEKKSALLCPKGKGGQIPEHYIGGSILLSKGGSVQVSVKGGPHVDHLHCSDLLQDLIDKAVIALKNMLIDSVTFLG